MSQAVPVPIIATPIPTPITKTTELKMYVGSTEVAKCNQTFSVGVVAIHIMEIIGDAIMIAIIMEPKAQRRFVRNIAELKILCLPMNLILWY
jgi:hypothetical protein